MHHFHLTKMPETKYKDAIKHLSNSETGYYMPSTIIPLDTKPLTMNAAQEYLNEKLDKGEFDKSLAYAIPLIDSQGFYNRFQEITYSATLNFEEYYNNASSVLKPFDIFLIRELLKPYSREHVTDKGLTIVHQIINESINQSSDFMFKSFSGESIAPTKDTWKAYVGDYMEHFDSEAEAIQAVHAELRKISPSKLYRTVSGVTFTPGVSECTNKIYSLVPHFAEYEVVSYVYPTDSDMVNDGWGFYTFNSIF